MTLVDALWTARLDGTSVAARVLSLEEGRAVLAALTRRAVDGGDEVAGWKIARLPDPSGGDDVFFVGPVFASSLQPVRRPLSMPKLEVEFVAVLGEGDVRSWHVGFELVENHDPEWSLQPGWACADWAVHAAAVLGDTCDEPTVDAPVDVRLSPGGGHNGSWRTGRERLLTLLDRDCAAIHRPAQPGDLVWSGALLPPVVLPADGRASALVGGAANAHLAMPTGAAGAT